MSAAAPGLPSSAAVIGLGLVGGSLARDLAAGGVAVTGVDADPAVRREARAAGLVGDVLEPDAPLPPGLDVVVVAVPLAAVPGVLRALATRGPDAAIVTDVASTKRSVLAAAAAAGLGSRFVGGHPMAGDHRSGWPASRAGLFAGAAVWLCPGAATDDAVERVRRLWTAIGARPALIDPASHDRLVALGSHLPQAAASALGAVLAHGGVRPDRLGPGGLGATRLAASDPELWTGILLDNGDEIAPALDALASRLGALREHLLQGDAAAVRAWLLEAREWAEAVAAAGPAG